MQSHRQVRTMFKDAVLDRKLSEFKAGHPGVYDWCYDQAKRGNSFATSLLYQLDTRGALSENQVGAVRKSMERLLESKNAPPKAELGEPTIKLLQVFERARANGYKKPTVRTEHFDFSLAPDHGVNKGFIYVKDEHTGEYLGKVDPQGRFHDRAIGDRLNLLLEVCKDPLDAAVKYGKKFGRCSCCGRELSNEESVELGIGPICREKFFGP